MKLVLIGATSAIVHATARRFASVDNSLYLVGRDTEKMSVVENDLKARGAKDVKSYVTNFLDPEAVRRIVQDIITEAETIDVVLVGHGVLPDQDICAGEYESFLQQLDVNFLSAVSFIQAFRDHLIERGAGIIAIVSSVAGDRGRKSNYAYGTAKGALSLFAAGLRNELYTKGVHVLTIKPGFVDTPMTTNVKKGPLFATPDKVAGDIERAIRKKSDVLYTPWFWRWIMLIICSIPERLFKRLSL